MNTKSSQLKNLIYKTVKSELVKWVQNYVDNETYNLNKFFKFCDTLFVNIEELPFEPSIKYIMIALEEDCEDGGEFECYSTLQMCCNALEKHLKKLLSPCDSVMERIECSTLYGSIEIKFNLNSFQYSDFIQLKSDNLTIQKLQLLAEEQLFAEKVRKSAIIKINQ